MRSITRAILAIAVTLTVTALTAGCSGSNTTNTGGAGRVVVSFDGHGFITAGMVKHWVAAEAILSHYLYPQEPSPTGLVPDPPKFTACIAYERNSTPQGTPTPTTTQLRQACRKRYEEVRGHMLQLLIGYRWMEVQARAHGIHATEAEINAYEHPPRKPFRSKDEYERYLKDSGETRADLRQRVRFDIELSALREKLEREHGIAYLRTFYRQYAREYKTRTSCAPGYVIPECKQYKGPEEPQT